MRKSQQVYSFRGYKLMRDGQHKIIVGPKGNRVTRFDMMRVPFVSTSRRPMEALSSGDTEARRGRRANVRTRQNLYMDPTDSTKRRFRQLEGKIKQGSNEEARRALR